MTALIELDVECRDYSLSLSFTNNAVLLFNYIWNYLKNEDLNVLLYRSSNLCLDPEIHKWLLQCIKHYQETNNLKGDNNRSGG